MNVSVDVFNKQEVEEWLKLIGSTPNEVADEKNEWHIEFDYPIKTQERTHIVCPDSQRLIIVSQVNVSPQHSKVFDELPSNEQREFSLRLRHELTRPEVDFKLDGSKGLLECPNSIQISRTRFREGLTLDSFYESIGCVFKAKMSAILFINLNLESTEPGTNKFGFKPMHN